jgi:hypothetical protein
LVNTEPVSSSASSNVWPDVTGWPLVEAEAALQHVIKKDVSDVHWTFNVIRTAPPARKNASAPAQNFGEWRVLRWSVLSSPNVLEVGESASGEIVHTVEIVAAREIVAAPVIPS